MREQLKLLFDTLFRMPPAARLREAFIAISQVRPFTRGIGYVRESVLTEDFLVLLVIRWPDRAIVTRRATSALPSVELTIGIDEADALWDEIDALNNPRLGYSFPLTRDSGVYAIGFATENCSRVYAYHGLKQGSTQQAIADRLEAFFGNKELLID